MSIDELIEAAAELDERTAGLFERLARITARATGEHGVAVTVNLDGKLIDLDLTETSVRLGASALAAEISRLTQQASAAALAEGMNVLGPIAGDDLDALLQPILSE
jgi:glutamate-1-semialdehyde aminotransferase